MVANITMGYIIRMLEVGGKKVTNCTHKYTSIMEWKSLQEKKKIIEMSCADNPFFLFPLTENYKLHYIRFSVTQITQQEQILAKYFCCLGKVTNILSAT